MARAFYKNSYMMQRNEAKSRRSMMMGGSKLNDDINITERKHLKQNFQDNFVCDEKNGKIPPSGRSDRNVAINTGENCPNNPG